PLFVEQIVSSFIDDGLLRVDPTGGWTVHGAMADADVPPTIAALLSARVDKLPAEEKALLETGSVAGAVFHRGAVQELSAPALRERVPATLAGLGASGRRAIARGDIPAAANLIERAMAALPEGDRGRIELAVDLGETLREKGDFTRAADVLRTAIEGATAIGDVALRTALTLVEL